MATIVNRNWSGVTAPKDVGWKDKGGFGGLTVQDTGSFGFMDGWPWGTQFLTFTNDNSNVIEWEYLFGSYYAVTKLELQATPFNQAIDDVPFIHLRDNDGNRMFSMTLARQDSFSATNNIYINGIDTGITFKTPREPYRIVFDNINYVAETFDVEIFEDGISVYTNNGMAFNGTPNGGGFDRLAVVGQTGDTGPNYSQLALDLVNAEGTIIDTAALITADATEGRATWTRAELENYGLEVTEIEDAFAQATTFDYSDYAVVCLVRSFLTQAQMLGVRADGAPTLACGLEPGERMRAAAATSFGTTGIDPEVYNDTHPIWVSQGKSNGQILSKPIWFAEWVPDGGTYAGTVLSKSNANLSGVATVEVWEVALEQGENDVDSNPVEARFVWVGWWYPSSNPHTAPFLELRPHIGAVLDWLTTTPGPVTPTLSVGTVTGTTADLSGSAYSNPESPTHAASQWQVDVEAGDFSTPVVDSGEDAVNLTSYTAAGLTAGTDYKARVRYKDSSGFWSAYSTAVSFSTPSSNFTENPDPGTDRFSDCAAGTDRFSPCGGAGTDRFTSC